MELVSVVVPIYNKCNTIRSTIESICLQTYSNIEVVLVDDGCDDDSVNIAITCLSSTKIPYKLYHTDGPSGYKPIGYAYPFMVGVCNSNGSFVTIHGADDISMPDRIEKLVNAMGNSVVSVSDTLIMDNGKESIWDGNNVQRFDSWRDMNGYPRTLILSTLFRKDVFMSSMAYMFSNSFELSAIYAMYGSGKFSYVNEVLYKMNCSSNMTISNINRRNKEDLYADNNYRFDDIEYPYGKFYYYSPWITDIAVDIVLDKIVGVENEHTKLSI